MVKPPRQINHKEGADITLQQQEKKTKEVFLGGEVLEKRGPSRRGGGKIKDEEVEKP